MHSNIDNFTPDGTVNSRKMGEDLINFTFGNDEFSNKFNVTNLDIYYIKPSFVAYVLNRKNITS